MKRALPVTTLFLDIGGVLLSDGWGLGSRTLAAKTFDINLISSCFVHLRKPDADIFRLALDTAQVPANQIVYIENTPMFIQIAEGLEIRSILHRDYRSTCAKLASFGLQNDE